MIEIDGSFGEGGGQILRTSLSLSSLLGKPFRICNIRRGRQHPGLRPQHLTSIRAAAMISNARVEGAEEGAFTVAFHPGRVQAGDYSWRIGTAGATSLVFQTLLPPLLYIDGISTITLTGGTHVPFSPSFHYLRDIFIPALALLGITVDADLITCGYYPRGGGEVLFRVIPCHHLGCRDFAAPGTLDGILGLSAVSRLPLSIAFRQRDAALAALAGGRAEIAVEEFPAPSPGTFLFLKAMSEQGMGGACALGERGKPAEDVGRGAAAELNRHLSSGACLDPHLADQIVLYLALAEGESVITTSALTDHLRTNLHVIATFTGATFSIEPPYRVIVRGCGFWS